MRTTNTRRATIRASWLVACRGPGVSIAMCKLKSWARRTDCKLARWRRTAEAIRFYCNSMTLTNFVLIICNYSFLYTILFALLFCKCRSQWPRGLRPRSAAARLLRLWVRIPPEAWIFVCCECCVLSGKGLCDALITRPEESYRLWCVVVCDLETSWMRRPCPNGGCSAKKIYSLSI